MIKNFAPKITGQRWGGFSRFPNLLALEKASTLTRDFSRELGCFLLKQRIKQWIENSRWFLTPFGGI